MNQKTEAFLIQLRDLCRSHGVSFVVDSGYVDFNSTDNSTAGLFGRSVSASLGGLGDLEFQLERARELRILQAAQIARGKPDPTP